MEASAQTAVADRSAVRVRQEGKGAKILLRMRQLDDAFDGGREGKGKMEAPQHILPRVYTVLSYDSIAKNCKELSVFCLNIS